MKYRNLEFSEHAIILFTSYCLSVDIYTVTVIEISKYLVFASRTVNNNIKTHNTFWVIIIYYVIYNNWQKLGHWFILIVILNDELLLNEGNETKK